MGRNSFKNGEPQRNRTSNLLIKSQHGVLGLLNTFFSFKSGWERHLKSQQSGGRIISLSHYLLARCYHTCLVGNNQWYYFSRSL